MGVGLGDIVVALASGCSGRTCIYDGCVGDVDRRDGGGGIVAAAGDVRAAARRRPSGAGDRRVGVVFGEPHLREFCRRRDVSWCRVFNQRVGGRKIGP